MDFGVKMSQMKIDILFLEVNGKLYKNTDYLKNEGKTNYFYSNEENKIDYFFYGLILTGCFMLWILMLIWMIFWGTK